MSCEELRRQIKQLEAARPVLDTMPLMLFLKDTKNNILFVNKAVAESLDVEPAEMANTPTKRWYPDDADNYYKDDLKVIQSRKPLLNIVEQLSAGHSGRHWIRTNKHPLFATDGSVSALVVIVKDATAQALAEEALLHSEQKLRTILASSPDLLLVLDDTGRYREIHSQSQHLLYLPKEDLLGRSIHDVFPEEIAAAAQLVIDRTLETDELQEIEYELTINGEPTLFSARVVPLVTGDDRCVLWSANDVTRQAQEEARRRALESRVQHSEQLESLRALTGRIAHEFDNLLVGVLENVRLAMEELPSPSPAWDPLQGVESAARRADELCQQMLSYSGPDRLVVEPLDLNEIVSGMTNLMRASMPDSASLRLQLGDQLPLVTADRAQLRQVITNLITNAVEATDSRTGEIRVNTATAEFGTAQISRWAGDEEPRQGRYVLLEVVDSGCGMDDDTIEKMFDPLFTTKSAGRGLGLAAVLGIMRAHGGGVDVVSKPSRGTSIRVMFPTAELADEAQADAR